MDDSVGGGEEILLGRQGGLATILINRSQALNALSLANYRTIDRVLDEWEADPAVHAVAIRGAGGRAFCAGGDVRAIYEAGRAPGGDRNFPAVFFREEYALVRRVHRFPKPYIAIIDGITMGGGAGMSINGAFRVATEHTVFAMPETGIGLFPDVGATRFLNRCPGHIGRYLGLCGHRLQAADTVYCGLATHFVPAARIEDLLAALGRTPESVAAVLAEFAEDPGPAPLVAIGPVIDRCFAGNSVETILAALEAEERAKGAFAARAAETRAGLATRSPTSLKITLRQLILGRNYEIEDALALEYRLTQHVLAEGDFYEGVRATVIDKDRRPRWQPATLAAVDEARLARYFAPLGEGELRFG